MAPPARQPRAVVERFVDEVLNGGRPEAAGSLVAHPDIRRRAQALRRAFPDLEVRTLLILAEGQDVALHLAARGTHRGMFQGLPATNRRWAASCTAIYRVAGGRIVDGWESWDLLGLLEQVGGVRRAAGASA